MKMAFFVNLLMKTYEIPQKNSKHNSEIDKSKKLNWIEFTYSKKKKMKISPISKFLFGVILPVIKDSETLVGTFQY